MMKSYICPNCFRKNKISNVVFLCKRCNTKKDLEQIANRSRLNGVFTPKISRTNVGGRHYMPVKAKCSCGRWCSMRLCPKCYKPLPDDIENSREIILTIGGDSGSGKTQYMGVLLNELENEVIRNQFSCTFKPFGDTKKRYQQYYYEPLYKWKVLAEKGDTEEIQPFIYTMKIKSKKVILVFYEIAQKGSNERREQEKRALVHSSGVLFFMDPLQLYGIRDHLMQKKGISKAEFWESCQIDPEEISFTGGCIKKIKDTIRKASYIHRRKANVSAAIVLPKLDVMKVMLMPGEIVLDPSKKRYDPAEMHRVSEEIRSLIELYMNSHITKRLRKDFKKVEYFSVSSLGEAPRYDVQTQKRKIKNICPHRVQDPVLWILSTLGIQ